MRSKLLVLIGGLAAAALVVGSLTGQQQAAPQDDAAALENLPVKEYDVAPLLMPIPDWRGFAALMDMLSVERYGGGGGAGGSGGGGLFTDTTVSDPENSGTQRLRALIERLVRSEEPWESEGGRATLDFYERSGIMLISQTPKGHAAVADLLARLIAERTKTLVVTVRAVELDAAYRDSLLDQGPLVARTPEEKKALAAAVKQVYCRSMVSGANGQGLCNNVGEIQSYVNDLEPIVAESAISYDPMIETIPNGLAVRLRPQVAAVGDAVRLDYIFCYARLTEMRQSEIQGTSGGAEPGMAKAKFDLPTCDADQRAGTITLPLNCPTVIGGGTVPKRLVTGKDDDTGAAEVDYIVTVRLMQP